MPTHNNITPFQKQRLPSKAFQEALEAVSSNNNPSPEDQIYIAQTAALLSTMILPIAQLSITLSLNGYIELAREIDGLVSASNKLAQKLSNAAGVPQDHTPQPPKDAA